MSESFNYWMAEEQPMPSPGNFEGFENWSGDEPTPGPEEEALEPRQPAAYFDGPTIF